MLILGIAIMAIKCYKDTKSVGMPNINKQKVIMEGMMEIKWENTIRMCTLGYVWKCVSIRVFWYVFICKNGAC